MPAPALENKQPWSAINVFDTLNVVNTIDMDQSSMMVNPSTRQKDPEKPFRFFKNNRELARSQQLAWRDFKDWQGNIPDDYPCTSTTIRLTPYIGYSDLPRS